MRILIDNLTAATQPLLAEYGARQDSGHELKIFRTTHHSATGTEIFNPFLPPSELIELFQTFQPDVLIVSSGWLIVSAMLLRLLELGNSSNSRRLLASGQIDNVLKVKAVHHGFHDVVDVSAPVEQVFETIQLTHNGFSSLDNDRLWNIIGRPAPLPNISLIPKDKDDLTILDLMRIGLPDRDIAKVISMSHQTVRNRVSAMLERSGLRNRTEMAWMFTNQMLIKGMMDNINAHKNA